MASFGGKEGSGEAFKGMGDMGKQFLMMRHIISWLADAAQDTPARPFSKPQIPRTWSSRFLDTLNILSSRMTCCYHTLTT